MKWANNSREKKNKMKNIHIDVDLCTFEQLMKYKTLYTLGGEKYFEEFIYVKTCQKCQRYGHVERGCRNTDVVCSYCAGEHRWHQCTSTYMQCKNCMMYNERNPHDTVNVEHTAYDRKCPCYIHVRNVVEKKLHT